MSATLWILSALFGFALVVQLFSYLYKLRQQVSALQNEIDTSTQTMFECRRKTEWLEGRLEDLLDAAQLRSGDETAAWDRLDHVTRTIKGEARQNGYRIGLGDIDQPD